MATVHDVADDSGRTIRSVDAAADPFGSTHVDCPHIPAERAAPAADQCQECGSGVNLRLCATCGHVGCCESQAGHARTHALSTRHPVIYQMPAGSGFIWCYVERAYVS